MKSTKTAVWIAALALFTFGPAQAQLLKKIGKAADQVNTANDIVKATGSSGKAVKGKVAGATGSISGMKLNWSQYNLTPAVTFNSLLYGTQVFMNGGTRLENYTATFVPNTKAGGGQVNTIYDQAEYLKIKVFKGDQFITYFEYDGGQQFDEGKKIKYNKPTSRYQINGEWVCDTDIDLKKWGVGNYRLDFVAGDKTYYSFDFEVAKVTNNDTYAGVNEMYVARGPWNNYAYMNHADTGNLLFGFYLTHEEFKPDPANARNTTKKVKWSVKLLKDGKPYAQHSGNGPNASQVRQAEWGDNQCAFKLTDKPNETLKFANLTDGAYKVELTVEGEPKPRQYHFDVKDKKIVQIPEQDRNKNTDPTRLIEGWNDYFWMKLVK